MRLIGNYRHHHRYYKQPGTVGDIKNMLMCSLCPNMCRFDCPTSEAAKKESGAPATRSKFAYYLEMNKLDGEAPDVVEDCARYTWLCADCDGCNLWCPMNLSVGQLNHGLRADLVTRGISPAFAAETNGVLDRTHNAFEQVNFSSFAHDAPAPQVFYFIGCMTALNHPDVIQANFKLLDRAGVSFSTAIAERWCCGAPAWVSGYRTTAELHAKHNASLVKTLGAKIVLFDCPECLKTWTTYYPALGVSPNVQMLHSSEFFLQLLKQGKLVVKPLASKKLVTFHDPCVLGRKLAITQPPRDILAFIKGVELKEPFIRGRETHCCGYGGMLPYSWPEYAQIIGVKRLEELGRTGARTIVTACPSCETAFLKYDLNSEFEILDIAQILADAVE